VGKNQKRASGQNIIFPATTSSLMLNPAFERYIGIDHSGAETPKSSLKGLRVYEADRLTAAHEIEPAPSPQKYWICRGLLRRWSRGFT